jgi:hypothetical protein
MLDILEEESDKKTLIQSISKECEEITEKIFNSNISNKKKEKLLEISL